MLILDDCISYLSSTSHRFDTVFMDPPDNIGLDYDGVHDRMPSNEYYNFLTTVIDLSLRVSRHVWVSFNAKHTVEMGVIGKWLKQNHPITISPCVQTFTFGQNCKTKLGNGHRPLWLFSHNGAPIFPNAIKVPSWRQLNGDKRAASGGKVPLDVFDFPRVTGNSKQRRPWHPTQLHEGLVERCIKYTTPVGGMVLDPFAGTGTTIRVCMRLGMSWVAVEKSEVYCKKICQDLRLTTLCGTTTLYAS